MKANAWRALGALLLGMMLAVGGCGSPPERPADEASNAAASKPAAEEVYAYGVIEARHHSTLSAKFPGKIERILVKEGERVRKGQLLALFEARELAAQLEAARAQVKVAEAVLAEALAGSRNQEIAQADEDVKAAAAELAKARLDWQRSDKLFSEGSLSQSAWEAARLRLDNALAGHSAARERLSLLREGTRQETIAVLKSRVDLAKAQVGQAEAALANARLTAPYDGVITRKHREEGEAMDIGLPVMDISTLDDLYVRAEIDETDIGKIRVGQTAVVTADGFPGLEYTGRVVEIKHQMGPKRLIPTDPAKIIDYKVLDIEISLPGNRCAFPVKLPVNVRILLSGSDNKPPGAES